MEDIEMGPGALSRRLRRFWSTGVCMLLVHNDSQCRAVQVLLDNEVLRRALVKMIGNITFEQAYKMTGRIVNITGACQ